MVNYVSHTYKTWLRDVSGTCDMDVISAVVLFYVKIISSTPQKNRLNEIVDVIQQTIKHRMSSHIYGWIDVAGDSFAGYESKCL